MRIYLELEAMSVQLFNARDSVKFSPQYLLEAGVATFRHDGKDYTEPEPLPDVLGVSSSLDPLLTIPTASDIDNKTLSIVEVAAVVHDSQLPAGSVASTSMLGHTSSYCDNFTSRCTIQKLL
jgi:hypothetical protein